MIFQYQIKFYMNLIFLGLWLAFSSSCSDKKIKEKDKGLNLTNELPKLDPNAAKVQLNSSQPRIGPANSYSSLQVPIIDLTHIDADMVQILRCSEGALITNSIGQNVQTLIAQGDTFYNREQLKWTWQEAWGNHRQCKVVGSNIVRNTIEDLGAEDGRFFYIINPCVSQTRSITGKEGCSYNIALSGLVEYKNNLKPEFIRLSKELSELEGLLATHFNNLFYYARQIRDKTRQCEDMYAHDQTKGGFLRGIIKIAAGIVGAVVGFYIGGGPMGAVAGASLLMGVASAIFRAPPAFLECPQVDDFIMHAKHTTSLLEPQVAKVIEVRKEMANIESSYAALDLEISSGGQQSSSPATNNGFTPGVNTGDSLQNTMTTQSQEQGSDPPEAIEGQEQNQSFENNTLGQ
ncbi:MAG: hypothetical protein R3B45_08615 [Bdellovibrionota bacterium]